MVSGARPGSRALFPDLEPVAYLSHAAISPPSEPVRAAVASAVEEYARRGAAAVPAALERRARLRGKLAWLVGAQPAELALLPNTTSGIVAVAQCFPWRPGDRVLLFQGEFPANVTPWQRAAEAFGLEAALLPLDPFERGEAEGLESLERELRRGARLVAVSAVQFQTGLRMPLGAMAALCARHGAELFVDAVQACGVVPLDAAALGLDYLAAGSHKWLMGILGAGFLYVRSGREAALRPRLAGWLSHEHAARFLSEGPGHLRYDRPIRRRADFLESGSAGEAALAGLEASVDLLAALGVPAIHAHVNGYLDLLEPELVARGFRSLRAHEPERRSGILSLRPPPGADPVRLQRSLAARGVACSVPDGLLRFSPHWPNDPAEVPGVVRAVESALGE